MVKYESGYSYIGLFLKNRDGSFAPKAGVNEIELVMTSLSESTQLEAPHMCPGDRSASDIIKDTLLHHDSVEDVKGSAKSLFSKAAPAFYMLADKKEIIYVEIAPKPQGKCNTSVPPLMSIVLLRRTTMDILCIQIITMYLENFRNTM